MSCDPLVDAFPQISGGSHTGELLAFDKKSLGYAQIDAERRSRQDGSHGKRRMSQYPAGKRVRRRHQILMRDDLIDQAQLKRAAGRKRIASQKQFKRTLAACEPWQALRSAKCRRHSKQYFGFGEKRPLTGDRQRRGFGDFAAAAEGKTVHGGDHRFPKRFQPRSEALAAHHEIAHRHIRTLLDAARKFMNVGAGGKGALPGPGQYDRAYRSVGFNHIEKCQKAIYQRIIQRVQFFRAVERENCHPILRFIQNKISHFRFLPFRTGNRMARTHACVYSLVGILFGMEKQKISTRERIVSAAAALFYEDGIRAVSVDAVAEKAGITKRTLYYHFTSKDDLVAAYLETRDQPNLALFKRWFATSHGDLPDKIGAIFSGLGRAARSPKWRGCGFLRTAAELANMPGHPAIKMGIAHKKRVEDWLCSVIESSGIERDARQLARQIVLLMDGSFALMLLHRDPSYVEAAGEAARDLVRFRERAAG
jgi:AcrR family transcriptional regulator